MKAANYSLALGLIIMTACGGQSTFKGTAKSLEQKVSDNAAPEPASTETEVIVPVVPEPVIPVVEQPALVPIPDPIQVPKVCKEKLEYNPSEILCSLPIDGSVKTTWTGEKWTTEWMINKGARWINPLAPVSEGDTFYCPYVPGSEKVLYVSHMILAADDEITVESVIDDIGQVRLWKNADPKQEVFISARSHKSSDKVKLAAGFYTIVIDGVDTGKKASGTVTSLTDSKGAVIRETESSDSWCIFRLSDEQDIAEFLLSASACRSCMIGAANVEPVK